MQFTEKGGRWLDIEGDRVAAWVCTLSSSQRLVISIFIICYQWIGFILWVESRTVDILVLSALMSWRTKFLTFHWVWIDHVTDEHRLSLDVWGSKSRSCPRLFSQIINGIWRRSAGQAGCPLINVGGRRCRVKCPWTKLSTLLSRTDVPLRNYSLTHKQ